MLYNGKNPHGGDIYGQKIILDFSANTNPLGTPEGVKRAIRDSLETLDRYPDPFCRRLGEALAGHEGVPVDYLICGNGAAEVIYAYCAAVGGPGGLVAAETAPTFAEYSLALENAGCRIIRYPLKAENSFDLDSGFLDFLKAEKPDIIFLCNPNNPTGRLIEEGLLLEIIKYCGENKIRFFLDECFLDLSDGGRDAKDLLRDNPHLFILKAFTKSYGIAGVRLGYGMTSDKELLEKMAKAVQPWNVSSIAQAAGIAALKETEFLEDARRLISCERAWMKAQLEGLGYYTTDSKTNYLLFKAEENLAEKLLGKGIAIRKCDNYHGLCSGWFRTAVRTHKENEQLINAIKEIKA